MTVLRYYRNNYKEVNMASPPGLGISTEYLTLLLGTIHSQSMVLVLLLNSYVFYNILSQTSDS